MSVSMALFTFLNAWWVMLFFTLPFGIEPSGEGASNPAAPKQPQWKKKLIITTILAAFVTLALALIIKSGIIPLRDILDS